MPTTIPVLDVVSAYDATQKTAFRDAIQAAESFQINPLDYGCVGDGVADDTVGLQAAFNAWVTNQYSDMVLPAGSQFKTTASIVVQVSEHMVVSRRLSGYGSSIQPTSAVGDVLTITSINDKQVRNFTIAGLDIRGPATGFGLVLTVDATVGDATHGFTVRECIIEGTVSGIKGYGNFFESSFENNHIDLTGYTGYGFYFDNNASGTISSLTLTQNTTRKGKNGICSAVTATDINIIGGTYLLCAEEGIFLNTAQGGHITGAHVEGCWATAASSVEGQAGIHVVVNTNFTLRDIFAVNSGGKMANAIKAYSSSDTNILIVGGIGGSLTNFAQLQCKDDTSAYTLVGEITYSAIGTLQVTHLAGQRILTSVPSKRVSRSSATGTTAVLTPTNVQGVYHIIHGIDIVINDVAHTPQYGDELEIILQKSGVAAGTITWGSSYVVPAITLPTVADKITRISLRWLNYGAADKWVCTGLYQS